MSGIFPKCVSLSVRKLCAILSLHSQMNGLAQMIALVQWEPTLSNLLKIAQSTRHCRTANEVKQMWSKKHQFHRFLFLKDLQQMSPDKHLNLISSLSAFVWTWKIVAIFFFCTFFLQCSQFRGRIRQNRQKFDKKNCKKTLVKHGIYALHIEPGVLTYIFQLVSPRRRG